MEAERLRNPDVDRKDDDIKLVAVRVPNGDRGTRHAGTDTPR